MSPSGSFPLRLETRLRKVKWSQSPTCVTRSLPSSFLPRRCYRLQAGRELLTQLRGRFCPTALKVAFVTESLYSFASTSSLFGNKLRIRSQFTTGRREQGKRCFRGTKLRQRSYTRQLSGDTKAPAWEGREGGRTFALDNVRIACAHQWTCMHARSKQPALEEAGIKGETRRKSRRKSRRWSVE